MLISSLNSIVSSLLGAETTAPAPQPVQQTSPAAQTPAASTTSGVVFDLSDTALQAAAAASPDGVVATAPDSPWDDLPPFTPAGMTIAAAIAALNAAPTEADALGADAELLQSPAATPAAPLAQSQPAGTAAIQQSQAANGAAAPARAEIPADLDEEARARASAIQAQERHKLLSLAERLTDVKADDSLRPNSAAEPEPQRAFSL